MSEAKKNTNEAKAQPRYRQRYENEIRKALMEKFGFKNEMQIPKLDKIVINMGVSEATTDRKAVECCGK